MYNDLAIGLPKEVQELESRVALVPNVVKYLVKKRFRVIVESGAGEVAGFTDAAYTKCGAEIVDTETVWRTSETIIKIRPP